ncbi:MAG TPA: division/cell wall cluster transcriptional repressor MraZ [Luteibaculaceae bacterium]|nr:division/cell wall cluster transcriptional repressor MraZ [Luteibaculaceae bacterium]
MFNLLGEYDCKLDPKGRLMLPVDLRKQLGEAVVKEGFVLNRDIFEKCLVLYPMSEWRKVSQQLSGLNRFVKKNAVFIRRFNNGATSVELDASGRLLLTKPLSEYAAIEKDVKVIGNGERIEIWSKSAYDSMLSEDIDFGSLSEEVMGGLSGDVE